MPQPSVTRLLVWTGILAYSGYAVYSKKSNADFSGQVAEKKASVEKLQQVMSDPGALQGIEDKVRTNRRRPLLLKDLLEELVTEEEEVKTMVMEDIGSKEEVAQAGTSKSTEVLQASKNDGSSRRII